jgi:hypothetical protein
MSDPIRWLDDGADVLSHERELLSAGRVMDPPPGAAEKIWATLGPHLGPGGGNGGGSSSNTSANGSSGAGSSGAGSSGAGSSGAGSSGASISGTVGGLKAAFIGIAGIVTTAGVIAAFVAASPGNPTHQNAPASQVVEAVTSTQAEDPAAQNPAIDVLGEQPIVAQPTSSSMPIDATPERNATRRGVSIAKPTVHAAPTPVEDANRVRQERASRLREESRGLGDARAALRNGDTTSALEKLDALSGQFPGGVLAQEREVLAIEALARAGQHAEASARAASFLKTYPTSPHATKLRGFLK